VFVLSIFRRVWLYQSYHGLTLARLYGLALLILLVGLMVTMALRYSYRHIKWVKVEAAWILVILFGTVVLNMESLVVKVPPTVNNRVDYVYLSRLSGDGYEGWKQAYDHTDKVLREIAEAKLPGIGVDQRREVLYGGLVLNNVTRNYDSLIWRYGTDEEIKNYLRQILDFGEAMLSKYPEIATSQVTGGREEVMKAINETRDMVGGDDWGKTGVVLRDETQNPRGTYMFSGYGGGFYGMQNGGLFASKRLSKFDRLLSYNARDNQLYREMSEDISISRVLQTIENYWRIRLQIITQPETERMVEVDISLNSPFLR